MVFIGLPPCFAWLKHGRVNPFLRAKVLNIERKVAVYYKLRHLFLHTWLNKDCRVKKIGLIFAAIFLVLGAIGLFANRYALACEMSPLLGYQQISDQVYVHNSSEKADLGNINQLMNAASARITGMYGPPISQPAVIITTTKSEAVKWGANETASMHRLPGRSCIVIGPEGLNTDVLAHEWLHAEIQHRVGFLRTLTEIPVWFDEGAALTVDFRSPFLIENINSDVTKIAGVQLLTRGKNFFSGSIRENYQMARVAVSSRIEPATFYYDLERISEGEKFEDVFNNRNL